MTGSWRFLFAVPIMEAKGGGEGEIRPRRRRAGRRVAGFVIMAQARLARRHNWDGGSLVFRFIAERAAGQGPAGAWHMDMDMGV